MFELSELEKLVSVLIIQEDTESIYSLIMSYLFSRVKNTWAKNY